MTAAGVRVATRARKRTIYGSCGQEVGVSWDRFNTNSPIPKTLGHKLPEGSRCIGSRMSVSPDVVWEVRSSDEEDQA